MMGESITFLSGDLTEKISPNTKNCVPCCLSCNGRKSDDDVLEWYRRQKFYDPRRAMAIRAWSNHDLKLVSKLLEYIH